jgi:DNA-binding transcriptional regulator GbsR (MarR family)
MKPSISIQREHRLSLIEYVKEKSRTIKQIADKLDISHSNASQIVKELELVNLVSKHKEGRKVYVKTKNYNHLINYFKELSHVRKYFNKACS